MIRIMSFECKRNGALPLYSESSRHGHTSGNFMYWTACQIVSFFPSKSAIAPERQHISALSIENHLRTPRRTRQGDKQKPSNTCSSSHDTCSCCAHLIGALLVGDNEIGDHGAHDPEAHRDAVILVAEHGLAVRAARWPTRRHNTGHATRSSIQIVQPSPCTIISMGKVFAHSKLGDEKMPCEQSKPTSPEVGKDIALWQRSRSKTTKTWHMNKSCETAVKKHEALNVSFSMTCKQTLCMKSEGWPK